MKIRGLDRAMAAWPAQLQLGARQHAQYRQLGGKPFGLGMCGLNEPERHEVHGDAVAAELFRQRLGERDRAATRCRGDGEAGLADTRRIAGKIDDAAALLTHRMRRNDVAAMNDVANRGHKYQFQVVHMQIML